MKKYKFINYDVKLTIEFKLATNPSKGIYYSLLIEIIDTILSKDKGEFGHIVYNNDLEEKCSLSIKPIKRHIKWLIDNNIIIKSNKSITNEKSKFNINTLTTIYREAPYQYKLHPSVNLSTLKLFVYESLSSVLKEKKEKRNYSLIKESPHRFDKKLRKLQSNLNRLSVDIEGALTELYHSNLENKLAQAKNVYKIAMRLNDNITYGNNVNRVYSNFTATTSKIKDYFYIDGYKTSEIDARASQITLISLLTREYESDLHKLIDSDDKDSFYNYLIKYIHENYEESKRIITVKNEQHIKKNIKKVETVNSKSFYISKDDIKGDVYAAIFSGFTNTSTVSKVIKELFGDAINPLIKKLGKRIVMVKDLNKKSYINGVKFVPMKTKQISNLARYLQNLEAIIFVDVASELKEPCITKHDGIYCKGSDVNKVVKAVKEKYRSLGLAVKDNHLTINYNKENIVKFVQPEIEVIIMKEINQSEIQKENGKIDLTIYKFINMKNGETFQGIKTEFAKMFNLDIKNINKVIKGKLKSTGSWMVIQ